MAFWERAVAFVLLAFAGCASQEEVTPMCRVTGLGEGPCCDITLTSATRLAGACIDGVCTDGAHRQADPKCVGTETTFDAQRPDATPPRDAAPDQGTTGDDASPDDASDPDALVTDASADGPPEDPCASIQCRPDQRCDPETATCVLKPTTPAGPCQEAAQCEDGDCLTEAASEGVLPGGFCRVACASDNDCEGGICEASGDSRLCFASCVGGCRAGWACTGQTEAGARYCLPDCREVGCGVGQRCDETTGVCEYPPECAYTCQAGETCEAGRCVRADGTCLTDYHCAASGLTCRNGRCIPDEFTDCPATACDASQTCILYDTAQPANGGLCLYSCQSDAACPIDRACFNFESGQACYYELCGASEENGTVYGSCTLGASDWQGTCMPIGMNNEGTAEIGLCFEAGTAFEGGACDDQATTRSDADKALRCGPGLLCFGDPDDALDPSRPSAGRGQCAKVCDPRTADLCNGNRRCVDFSDLDEPATAEDESRYLGLCLPTDCEILDDGTCGDGRHCRAYSLSSPYGKCGNAGRAQLGEPCGDDAECQDHAICVNAGVGPICLAICDPAVSSPTCAECYTAEGWSYGVCVSL